MRAPAYGPPPVPKEQGRGCTTSLAIFTALLNAIVAGAWFGHETLFVAIRERLGSSFWFAALALYGAFGLLTLIFSSVCIGVMRGVPRAGAMLAVMALGAAGVWVVVLLLGVHPFVHLPSLTVVYSLTALHAITAVLLVVPSSRR